MLVFSDTEIVVNMKKALIVDDDPSSAQLIARFLEPLDYEAEIAFSGAEAVECLNESTFDIVISDVRMPGGSGIDLLREMHGLNKRVPIVLVSAVAESAKAQAKALGADAFLDKPFTKEGLTEVVRQLEKTPHEPAKH